VTNNPKVTFLVPDIASPVLGPITVLAKTLQRHFAVEIVGPDFGTGVCSMYRGSFDYKSVSTPRMYRFPNYFREAARLADAISGDVIFSVKAFADTLPVALWEKRRHGRKVVVYLDEWDGALFRQLAPAARVKRRLSTLHHPLDDAYYPWVENLIRFADEVTSTSTFLQKKFGGRVLHMGVDTQFFQPQPSTSASDLKRSLGLESKRLIVFGGVVRLHKGIEQILDALVQMGYPAVQLLIVGPETEHVQLLREEPRYAPYLKCTGSVLKEKMPRYLSLADLVVLPLVDNLLAQSQVPCKIFEAMAMAKPIIASAVSDLPMILEGCGWVVPTGNVDVMSETIRHILSRPDEAALKGNMARDKCIRMYSREVTERELVDIVRKLV
jgi:glycosyltransferase involved in cell wall biosynthesis